MLYIKDDMKTSNVTLATSSGKEQITILGSRTPENEMKSCHKNLQTNGRKFEIFNIDLIQYRYISSILRPCKAINNIYNNYVHTATNSYTVNSIESNGVKMGRLTYLFSCSWNNNYSCRLKL